MGLQVGIVGLPNVGKSTLFHALTGVQAEAANYPFCTIDPNIGIVPVGDKRMDRLVALMEPEKEIPSVLQIVDIAGLVEGASKGEGLGNQFLNHIRQVDAIVHVIRCFDDSQIVHVAGKVNPEDDLNTIQTELVLADLEQVERKRERTQKQLKGSPELAESIVVYDKVLNHFNEGKPARTLELDKDEKVILAELNLMTMKPYLYLANVDDGNIADSTTSEHEKTLRAIAEREGVEFIKVCAQIESELAQMDAEEKQVFMEDLGIEESGLNRLSQACYRLLNQITFFTAGKQEVRAWNITEGDTAPQAAGTIHTDFERGFIRAEIFHYSDIDELGSEAAVKDAGRWRLEGKEYVMKDGDVAHFRFNV